MAEHAEQRTPEEARTRLATHVSVRDARDTDVYLEALAARHFNGEPFLTATITSPPYADVLDYGTSDQIGFGQNYADYLLDCKKIFADVARWTRDDGVLWMVADSAVESRKNGLPGRLRPIPFDLSREAEQSGWVLRDVIIWRKDRTRPWSGRGRLRNAFEYVMMFVKTAEFKYHIDRLRDNQSFKDWWVRYPERHNPWGMAPDNVWDIPIPKQGSWATDAVRHACPLPAELIRRVMVLSTDPGDVVFDPFAGSGMVAAVASATSRIGIGTEINPQFVDAFDHSVLPHVEASLPGETSGSSPEMTRRLLTLRVLKYPRELLRQAQRVSDLSDFILAAEIETGPFQMCHDTGAYATANLILYVASDLSEVKKAEVEHFVKNRQRVAPLSKYTLAVTAEIRMESELPRSRGAEYAIYGSGRTWRPSERVAGESLAAALQAYRGDRIPPIFSRLIADERTD